jgi:hypothetical protein
MSISKVMINPGPPKEFEEAERIKQSRGKVWWDCYKCRGSEHVSKDVTHLDHRHLGYLYLLKRRDEEQRK